MSKSRAAIAGSTADGPTNGVTIDDATAEMVIGPTAKIYNHHGYGVIFVHREPKNQHRINELFQGIAWATLNVNVLSSSFPIYLQ